MRNWIFQRFGLEAHKTSVKQELLAGTIGFITIVYIIAVNSSILSEAGIPLEAAMLATIISSFAGCVLMGLWGNAPIMLVPGMGINAMFTYTLVQSMGLSWQEALAVVFVSGILFTVVAVTRLSETLTVAIPASLKDAITVGLGLFLTLIGLEKGGLVIRGEHSLIALGHMGDPYVLTTLGTLFITVFLFMRNVPANFLISIVLGTGLAVLTGTVDISGIGTSGISLGDYSQVIGAMSFAKIGTLTFWVAVFSLTMVLVFENIGLVHGHLSMTNTPDKFRRSLQSNALSAISCGLFGTSPTVSTVESAAGIAAGGRTGLTAVTSGVLFLVAVLVLPIIKLVPGSAIAPVLMIIGTLMLSNVKNIDFGDLSEGFPAFLVIVMIPFTYSIADGIAFGFIAYPLLKVVLGKSRDVSRPLYVIALLFLLHFALQS
ncbi:NCS2 family permease [Brevibacillus dissolubilis]|uniref:NCS2 family permease n=1 Tax=Brevibacillus dissolubilis TaxID=1844116 RepID=UPI001116B924|nr:NCS2 family permease [Brevibacillus dissolubilis]